MSQGQCIGKGSQLSLVASSQTETVTVRETDRINPTRKVDTCCLGHAAASGGGYYTWNK